jgi:FkbM family methyltransferase
VAELNPSGGRAAALKRRAIETVPARWQLPLRYRLASLAGRLEPEMADLPDMVRPGSFAIDIAPNHGLYSYALSRLGVSVQAFEPQPWCANTIRGWASKRVDVRHVALLDTNGTLALRMPVLHGTRFTGYATFGDLEGESEAIDVPVRRLDDFGFTDVSFVKVDVEGHEARVLHGGERMINACRPTLLVEVEQRHLADGLSIEDVFGQILDYGYRGQYLLDGQWQPLDTFSVERFQLARLAGDGSAPYVNNFLFRPVGPG